MNKNVRIIVYLVLEIVYTFASLFTKLIRPTIVTLFNFHYTRVSCLDMLLAVGKCLLPDRQVTRPVIIAVP